jgi:Helicase HerA, central domain
MPAMPAEASIKTFEALGTFYLGRKYDLTAQALSPEPVLYDSRDLVTHAVIVGMTGSGKTGLGITLLEEALIDSIPVIAIDPKGDLANLLLTFPDLAPQDFRPWVAPEEAARQGKTVDAYAADQAQTWKTGLAQWGQDGGRIGRLKEAAEFAVYTPGSRAGLPVSILKSFAAPAEAERTDDERMAEAVTTTATSVLTLLDVDAHPVQSRQHILLSAILHTAWIKGEDLDLPAIIHRIQQPPFTRAGVLDLEAFYPEKDRFGLAMRLNGLLAAPSFAIWLEGQPLDVASLLMSASGKPRCAIVSIAHLSDSERMFFVTLLLNQIVSWMRAQSGTTSLRALMYMDEVAGYMPPVANPPSKAALLLLMKQARAYGLGVVLATQNPVDLDYKGLSNAGTWFLGRLQTERDKARLLDGLEGALASHAAVFDRPQTDQILSSLPKRVFFMHNVHEDTPEVFQTRWALSYLRGPLTREQIRTLRQKTGGESPGATATGASSAPRSDTATMSASSAPMLPRPAHPSPSTAAGMSTRPVLPPGVEQFYLPRRRAGSDGPIHYAPTLYARASVRFADAKRGVEVSRTVTRMVPLGSGAVVVDWESSVDADVPAEDLETAPDQPAYFAALPPSASKASSYQSWQKEFARWLYQTQELTLLSDEATGLSSKPGESEAEFRARVQLACREERDAAKDRLRQKYAPKTATLTEKIRRAEAAVAREQEQASQEKLQTAVSFGSTLLGALLGRKVISAGNVGRATTAARGVGRSMKEAEDVRRAATNVDSLKAQLANLEGELEAELAGLEATAPSAARTFAHVTVKPKKTQIAVERVVLVWNPE